MTEFDPVAAAKREVALLQALLETTNKLVAEHQRTLDIMAEDKTSRITLLEYMLETLEHRSMTKIEAAIPKVRGLLATLGWHREGNLQ